MKECRRCRAWKPLEDYSKKAAASDGLQPYCKTCNREAAKDYHYADRWRAAKRNDKWRQENPDKARAKRRRTMYNLTPERFEEMLAAQGGACAICESPFDLEAFRDTVRVDHDHSCCPAGGSCGKCIRGLTCGRCNNWLAAVDSAGWLPKAIQYIQRYSASKSVGA